MNSTQENRDAEIITPLGKDVLLLYNMQINEELGRLFSIETELISKKDDIPFEDLLGKNVTIRMNLTNGTPRFFNGHITRFSQVDRRDAFGGVYQATIQPWLWFLTRTADCRIFQEMTVQEIIKKVFSEWGHPFEDKLSRSYRTWEYCVQYRETDFNFISRLMEQEGIYYFFEHENGVHKLILADDYSPHKEIFTINGRVPLFASDEVAVRDEESCSNWHTSKSVLPGTYALNDYDFKRPSANLYVNSVLSKPHSMAEEEIYDYPGEYVQIDDGDQYSRNRIEELHSQYEVSQSSSAVRDMKAGGLFTLAEHPRRDQNKEYLLVSVSHSFQNDDYGAGGSGGSGTQYSNNITVIDSKTPFRTSQTTPKPIVQGPQTAIVVGPPSEEIFTDEYSRVKVQFPWDRYGTLDENSSCWIRVSQLWAGKNWGGIHIPRIGQEVIIEFLEGDPDRPIITGRVYNAEQMPPYDLPANKTQSGIKSRSSKGGTPANFNEIRMEDKKGEEELYIHAEKNHTNITENDRNENVGHDRSLYVGHDKSEKVKNNKKIDVVEGTHTETIKGDTTVTITDGHYVHRVVKGSETHHVEEMVTETFNDSQKTTVKKDIKITANTGKICITAATEIELHVGNSLLIMKKDGTIKLSGKDVSITGTKKTEMGVGSQSTTHDNKSIQSSGAEITSAAIGTHNLTGAIVKIN